METEKSTHGMAASDLFETAALFWRLEISPLAEPGI
jgi:hypothetical protein